jgi:hypothetical protein
LTALGRDLLQPVSALGDWALRNQGKIAKAREQFDGSANGAAAAGRLDALKSGLVAAARRN